MPPEHQLLILWKQVRKLLVQVDPRTDGNQWLARGDDVIQQFDHLDAGSYALRYPVAKDGSASLPSAELVDPTVVRHMIAELDILLNGASAQIAEYQGLKYEGY